MHCNQVYLISQVGREVVGVGVVVVAGQSHISVAKEDHIRCSAGNQKVRAHIKLFPLQEQWTLDVTKEAQAKCQFTLKIIDKLTENVICH